MPSLSSLRTFIISFRIIFVLFFVSLLFTSSSLASNLHFWPTSDTQLNNSRVGESSFDFLLENVFFTNDTLFILTNKFPSNVSGTSLTIRNSYLGSSFHFSNDMIFNNCTIRFINCSSLKVLRPYVTNILDKPQTSNAFTNYSSLEIINSTIEASPGQTADDPHTLARGVELFVDEHSANYSFIFINNTYKWISESYIRGESFGPWNEKDNLGDPKASRVPLPAIRIDIAALAPHDTTKINHKYFFDRIILSGNSFQTNHGWIRFFGISMNNDISPTKYYHKSPDNSQLVLRGNLINISDNTVDVRYFDNTKKSWSFWEEGTKDIDLLGLNLKQLLSCETILFQRNHFDCREFATFDRKLVQLNGFSLGAASSELNPRQMSDHYATSIIDSGNIILSDNNFYVESGHRTFLSFANLNADTRQALLGEFSITYFQSEVVALQVVQPRDTTSVQFLRNKIHYQGVSGGFMLLLKLGMSGAELDKDSRSSSNKRHTAVHIAYRAKHHDEKKNVGLVLFERNELIAHDSFQILGISVKSRSYFEFFGDLLVYNNSIDFRFDYLNLHAAYPDLIRVLKNYTVELIGYEANRESNYASLQLVKNYSILENTFSLSGAGSVRGIQLFGDESNCTLFVCARNFVYLNQSDYPRVYDPKMMQMITEVGQDSINSEENGRRIAFSYGVWTANSCGDWKQFEVFNNTFEMILETSGDCAGVGLASNDNPEGASTTFVFWDARVFNNTVNIYKTDTMQFEALLSGILVSKYATGGDVLPFGFVRIFNNTVNVTSSSLTPLSGANAVSINFQYIINKMVNLIVIEDNFLFIRNSQRSVAAIGLSANNRVSSDEQLSNVKVQPGDAFFETVIIRNNILMAVNERGTAAGIGIAGAGFIGFGSLVIEKNEAHVVSLSSSEASVREAQNDNVYFLGSQCIYGHTALMVQGFKVKIPIYCDKGYNVEFRDELILRENKIKLENHPSSLSVPQPTWFDYKHQNDDEQTPFKPPSIGYLRFFTGVVARNIFIAENEQISISTTTPQYPRSSVLLIDPSVSFRGESIAFGTVFNTNYFKNIIFRNVTVNNREYLHCFRSTSSSSSSSSTISNGIFLSVSQGSLPPAAGATLLNTEAENFQSSDVRINYEIADESQVDFCSASSSSSSSKSDSSSSSESLDFVKLADIDSIIQLSHVNLTNSNINLGNSLISINNKNIFASPSPLSFPDQNELFNINCFTWDNEPTFGNSPTIKSAVPLLKGLQVIPCKGAMLSSTFSPSHEATNSSIFTKSISHPTPSATSSSEMEIEDYGRSVAAQNALRTGQSAALIANLVASNPTLLLSVARSATLTALALCQLNQRDLTPDQKEKKFAGHVEKVLSRKLEFPQSLFPGVGFSSERGKFYRGSVFSFLILFVFVVLVAFFEGTVNKSKWKEYCEEKKRKRLNRSKTVSHQPPKFIASISFFEYCSLDKLLLKPILFTCPFWFEVAGTLATGETDDAGDVVLAIIPVIIIVLIVLWFAAKVCSFVKLRVGEEELKKKLDHQKRKKSNLLLKKKRNSSASTIAKIEEEIDELPRIPMHFVEDSDLFYPKDEENSSKRKSKSSSSSWKSKLRNFMRNSKVGRFAVIGNLVWNSSMKFVDLDEVKVTPGPGILTQCATTFKTYQGPVRQEKTSQEIEEDEAFNDTTMHTFRGNTHTRDDIIEEEMVGFTPNSSGRRNTSTSSKRIPSTSSMSDEKDWSGNSLRHLPIREKHSSEHHVHYKYDFSFRRKLQPLWVEVTLLLTMLVSFLGGISIVRPSTCLTHFYIVVVIIFLHFILLLWLRPYIVPLRTLAPIIIEIFTCAAGIIYLNLILVGNPSISSSSSDALPDSKKNEHGGIFSTLKPAVETQVQLAIALSSYPGSVIGILTMISCLLRLVALKLTKSIIVSKSVMRSEVRKELKELEQELLPMLKLNVIRENFTSARTASASSSSFSPVASKSRRTKKSKKVGPKTTKLINY